MAKTQNVALRIDMCSSSALFLLTVGGQALPLISMEETVALGEKILMETVNGENQQSLFRRRIFTLLY